MKILRVGDLHIKPSNIKESEILLGFIVKTAIERKVARVEFEGDIADTHSVVRLEVLEFWDRWFRKLSEQPFDTVVLAGNHDMTGSYSNSYSFLHPFKTNRDITFVTEPMSEGIYGYLPYIHDDAEFIKEANKLADLGVTVLTSHPNFVGATYDNGMPINNGVDPDLIDSRIKHLIGGHIHTENAYGRVWYIGTPRWFTKSCANKKKGIWLCEHDDSGTMTSKEFISTESVCTPIVSISWKEGEAKPEIPSGAKVDVELVGSSDWVSKTKKELAGLASVSSKITDTKKSRERKSGNSLHEFLSQYYPADASKRQKLISYLGDLKLV